MYKHRIKLLAFAFIILLAGCKKDQDSQKNEEDVYKEKLISLLHIDRTATKPANNIKGDYVFKTFKEALQHFEKVQKTKLTFDKTVTLKPNRKESSGNSAGRTLDDHIYVFYSSTNFSFSFNVTRGVNPAQLDINFSVAPLVNYSWDFINGYGIYQVVNMYFGDINYTYSSTEAGSVISGPQIDNFSFQQELQQSVTMVIDGVAFTGYWPIYVHTTGSAFASVPSPEIPNIMVSTSCSVTY